MHVRIEVVPWLTRAFGHTGMGRFVSVRPIDPGVTLESLLLKLAEQHPDFAVYALDQDRTPICPHVCLTLNGILVPLPAGLTRLLCDGDVLVLLPAYAGG